MFRQQMKFQKIMTYAVLAVCVLCFVYSLGLMTDIYDTFYLTMVDPDNIDDTPVQGSQIYYHMQDFNKQLLTVAIVLIVVSLTMFIAGMHNRRKYYVLNYISTGLVAVCNIAASIWMLIKIAFYRAEYVQIDFEALKKFIETHPNVKYNDSTFWFDIGYVICVLLIVSALAVTGNLIWKIIITKRENELLNGSATKEVTAQ